MALTRHRLQTATMLKVWNAHKDVIKVTEGAGVVPALLLVATAKAVSGI